MSTLTISPSNPSLSSSPSRNSVINVPPSPASVRSATSSKKSLDTDDDENVTITAKRTIVRQPSKQKSQEDLRRLAVSTHMTELSYSISDIQTRIFEIQELRHKSQAAADTATTAVIDQSLMTLDEKLEAVGKGIQSINDSLEPLLQDSSTPTVAQNGQGDENTVILRKHASLLSEWDAVQDESDVLREELKEDKWLTVFRTVTDQADGMMTSLEKGVNRCQEFIWQVRKSMGDNLLSVSQSSISSNRSPPAVPTMDTFTSILESFEAKKKHYMPATSKVLSIIDRGVRDRSTKNGETLRRHAESTQRWKNLRERITRTDAEMEAARKILLGEADSDHGSTTSGTTRNGYLATPPTGGRSSRAPSAASTLSRSISPFRKFARKIQSVTRSPVTPVTPLSVKKNNGARTPASEPPPASATQTARQTRTSLFGLRSSQTPTPVTPDRPSHKYSQSFTPDSPSRAPSRGGDATLKGRPPTKTPWNSSTKVVPDDKIATVRGTPPKRAPSAAGIYNDISSFRRSLSRTSMASSRPWSPFSSTASTNNSTSQPPLPPLRPPSRAPTPSRAPSRAFTPGIPATPRSRPKTPSQIPAPANKLRSLSGAMSEYGGDDYFDRAFSPAFSTSALSTATSPTGHPPRPPSRSMIPLPKVQLSSPSRPGSSFSNYSRADSPPSAFRSSAARAQTPESALRSRVQQIGLYQGTVNGKSPSRPSIMSKLPPSSFRDGSTSRTPSRAGSRAGAYTPTMGDGPLHEYIPSNPKDPLDVEVGSIVNAIAHGLLVERVDPPLKKIPAEGAEIKAQYAFSNQLSRKIVTCRLTTLTRTGKSATKGDLSTKKVMCRVGGGWQDLSHYILNRQAGM